MGAALLARHVLATASYPTNYALLFGLAAVALLIASLGFLVIREPPRSDGDDRVRRWQEYKGQLRNTAKRLRGLVIVQLLTGFTLMAIPFYVVYAKQELNAPPGAVGWFILAQVLGGIISNLLWARLVDRYSSQRMLTVCATISALTPLLAVALGPVGWYGLLPVVFVSGATMNGRGVGFSSALLELSPTTERPTYSALDATLVLPVAFLSLLGGVLLQHWSYNGVFVLASAFITLGAVMAHRMRIEQGEEA